MDPTRMRPTLDDFQVAHSIFHVPERRQRLDGLELRGPLPAHLRPEYEHQVVRQPLRKFICDQFGRQELRQDGAGDESEILEGWDSTQ